MFQNIGFSEILLIAVVALVLFGPQKLPEIGRMLGKTLRDFKQAANELMNEEPKAPKAANTPVPDPITPVVVAASSPDQSSSDESLEPVAPSHVQGSGESENFAVQAGNAAVKPAVAFITNTSPVVVQVAGTPIEAERTTSSPAVRAAPQAATDVLSTAPAHASAPTPARAQQSGSTSNTRRLPD